MLKKKILVLFAINMTVALMLVACSGNANMDVDGNVTVESTVEDTSGIIDTGNTDVVVPEITAVPEVITTPEPTINPDTLSNAERETENKGSYYRFVTISDTIYEVDFTLLDIEPIWNDVYLSTAFDVYDTDGYKVGFTKENIAVSIMAKNDEWTLMRTGGGDLFAKTDDVEASINASNVEGTPMPNTEATPVPSSGTDTSTENIENENNTTDEEEILPSYTVEEMSATMYATQSVNVRKGPSTDYDKIGNLSTNQTVTVTGKADNGWYRIDLNGSEAFVSGKYLSNEKVVVATPTPKPTEVPSVPDTPVEQPVVPPTPTEAPIVVPPTPTEEPQVKTYTEAEVISIVESTLRNAGFLKPEEVYPADILTSPTAGMGWAEGNFSMTDPQYNANELLSDLQYGGYDMYYLENLGSSNGYVRLRIYYGNTYL